MRYLGIDYGKKRIGLAISDEAGQLAFPKEILENSEKLRQNVFTRIGEIINEEKVEEMVVGDSFDYKGEPNAVMIEIRQFVESLQKEFSLPVRMQKEFLTSVEARRYQEGSAKADAGAAALILQRYLDRINK
ncbi:MAG TPA: Holliday junction resolvase RuvX [Candidatus Paceibacterota bacterium]|nr:Holliday junction resolvase RuvX [Candidatus Paceibacterota bacterium]